MVETLSIYVLILSILRIRELGTWNHEEYLHPARVYTWTHSGADALAVAVFLPWHQDKRAFCGFGAKAQVISQVYGRGWFFPLKIFNVCCVPDTILSAGGVDKWPK